ncbi:MAG: HTTM domain-containing protein [Cyclobacteriaceae bacterium]
MIGNAKEFLGSQVDNSSLVFFRMCYGFLVAAETFGAILTGWVERTLVNPAFTFSFIGFEWLQPLPGDGMYYYFIVMGICGLLIMLGLFYRVSTVIFFVLWTGVYLMQKAEYNNHYYLLVLLSAAMIFMPAHKSRSLDARLGITKESKTCLKAHVWFFILQILIVYVFASLNKVHMDWLTAKPVGIWFHSKASYWLIGPLLDTRAFQYLISWGGVLYDGAIVFLLLNRSTRKLGFFLSLFFNLFNSAVFQIGIFPYMMIAFTVFFYPPEYIRKLIFKDNFQIPESKGVLSKPLFTVMAVYFAIQLLLPIRHHLYEGDVHWSEEGHKMAWQMMLRSKSGYVRFDVLDKATQEKTRIDMSNYLSRRQKRSIVGEPDMIWQFAQRLKETYRKEGKDVAVFAVSRLSLNGHTLQPLIDPTTDLASVPWDRWKHSDWILTYDSYD